MPTPRERIEKIVENIKPTQVKFTGSISEPGRLILNPITISPFHILPNTDELQEAVANEMQEDWDGMEFSYVARPGNVDQIYAHITHYVVREYSRLSERCEATKRKTQTFIASVDLDNMHLANFVLQVYIKLKMDDDKPKMSPSEKKSLLENFESLRRTYGKLNSKTSVLR